VSAYVLVAVVSACVLVATAVLVFLAAPRRGRDRLSSNIQPGLARGLDGAEAHRDVGGDVRGDGHDPGAVVARERVELDERVRRAERAEALRNLLVSKMSHDLRAPLNSVITLSQLLAEGNAGALSIEQRRYVETIQRNGQKLLGLMNDILDLASLESGRLEVEPAAFDLGALAQAVADGSGRSARAKGLPLHLNLPRRSVLALADEDRLRYVVAALVEHAVGATRNGYVELSVEGDEHRALVRVADTGGGISREARDALYDDFLAGVGPFSGRASPPLSLVVAGRLVRLMGGTITVDSVGGEGTTFSIALPAAAETSPARLGAAASRAPGAENGAPLPVEKGSGHVLLIEDDEIERRRVGSMIETAGYDVTAASSGEEGLGLLADAHYDAVVLDLVMPGLSGLDVLRRARADERLAGTPFVVLSALYMTKGEREVLGPSVVGVLRKGDSSIQELAAQLRRAVSGATAVRGTTPPPAPRERAAASSARARVLVVEDNVDSLYTIERVLASLPVTMETASSGPEALETCRQHPPDLIMMDMELPGMSGLDTSRAIHALPACASVPIIALATDEAPSERPRDPAAQWSGYLSKPVQPLDVVSAVTRALQLAAH
jgi:CheY-like chemotaxis protein/signal transduction histidine kinase